MKKLKFIKNNLNLNTYFTSFLKDMRDNNGVFTIIKEDEKTWTIHSKHRPSGIWVVRKETDANEFVEINTFEVTIDDELFEI